MSDTVNIPAKHDLSLFHSGADTTPGGIVLVVRCKRSKEQAGRTTEGKDDPFCDWVWIFGAAVNRSLVGNKRLLQVGVEELVLHWLSVV